MKKRIAFMMCMLLTAVSIAGCGGKKEELQTTNKTQEEAAAEAEPSKDKPYAGTKLRVILANHNWTDAILPMIPEFEETTGIEVETESYAEDQLSEKLAIELTSGSNSLDVMMTRPLQEIKQFVKNGWVYDLSDLLKDEDFDSEDFIRTALDSYKDGDAYYGVPLVTERQIMYYRTDLFEQAGVEVPTTMDELYTAAEKLTDKDNGIYGIVSRGLTAAAVTQFSGYLYVKPLLTDIMPLSKAQEGFDKLFHREETGAIKVILKPDWD
ncbi:MAG: extracellular solute-binding protein [Blautia sp.]|jgi:multiple sugar transport system substrate-binding protein